MESETNKHIDSQKISQPFVDKLIIPFDYVDDLILVVNKDKKLIHFSKSVTSLLECSDEELVNIDVYNLFPENLKEKIVSYFNSENHNYFEDLPLISKNGQENFFEIKLSKGYWYNEEATFAILRNINERKKAEEQIKQSHILYSTTVNAIKEWIYVIDKNLNIVLVNDALINIHKELNLPVNIVGANLCEIYNFLPEEIISDHKLIFKTGKEIKREFSQTLNGRNFQIEAKVIPIFSQEIVSLALITLRDITSQKKIESELKNNEKRFTDIIYNVSDFVWEMNENGEFTFMTENIKELMGYDADEIIGRSPLFFMKISPPDSREKFRQILSGKKPIEDYLLNIPNKQNQKIWLRVNGIPIFDENNNFKGYRGVAKDITEFKIAQDKLAWNENILKLLSDNSLQGIYFINFKNDKVLFFNKKFCELWGIENLEKQIKQGLINHQELILKLSTQVKDSNQFLQSFKFPNHSINKLKFEYEFVLRDNRMFYSYSTQITNFEGIILGRAFIFEDITGIKIYDSLQKNATKHENLINQAPDAIIISDLELNIINVNTATENLLKYNKSELININVGNFMDPSDLVINPIRTSELKNGKTILMERVFINKNGEKISTEVRVSRIKENKIFAIIRDMSERDIQIKEQHTSIKSEILKKLYIKLKSFQHGENSAMILNRISLFTRNVENIWLCPELPTDISKPGIDKKIENLNRAKSVADEYTLLVYPQLKQIISLIEIVEIELPDFKIQGLSKNNIHDLNSASEFLHKCFETFLESTVVKTEIPSQYKNSRDIIESVKAIKKSLERILKIFENYFLTDLREEIYIVVNKYSKLHHDIIITFSDFSKNTFAIINNDELREILLILLSNSIEALSISDRKEKRINISLKDMDNKFLIEFDNNGVSIDKNLLPKLFFEEISTKGERRGFGLKYARDCIKKFGGEIYIDEKFQRGTRFIIELTPI